MNLNILLICSLGMTSSLLEMKIAEEAKKRGIECKLDAISSAETNEHNNEKYDVVLIAPQIRYMTQDIIKNLKQDDAVYVNIAPTDYGMMNAENVLNDTLKALEEKGK